MHNLVFITHLYVWLELFIDKGFEVINYQELQAPGSGVESRFFVPAEWAQKWPSEQVWQLRKIAWSHKWLNLQYTCSVISS